MLKQIHSILVATVLLTVMSCPFLNGETQAAVESYKKQEKTLSQRRFKQKKWFNGEETDLIQKRFSFEHWNKHYSSIGSKKWDYTSEKSSDKKRFKTGMADLFKKNKEIELSEWQDYLAHLESQAQISTDSTARITQDKHIYEKVLQQADNFKDTGETLSLRDINRFQFRKNRPKDDVPVTQAGSEEKAK